MAKGDKCHSCGAKFDFVYGAKGGELVPWCWQCFERDHPPETMKRALAARQAAQKFLDIGNAQ